MQVQASRVTPVVMELAVEVPADRVKIEHEKAVANLQRTQRIRGFRPGKAPRDVLTKLFGPQIANDVANAIVQGTLPKALSDQKLNPINQPQVFEAGKLETTAPFSYKARFEVTPEIAEVVYEGLELFRPAVEVGEAQVDEQLEALRKQHARLESPEPARPSAEGDVVTIDFTLDVDGKPVKEGGGQGVQLELGSGQVLPALDAGLRGKSADETADVESVFPDNHPREDFRGKKGVFHVTVKDVKAKVLPALDDEFAKDVGNFQTLVELRADVHTRLSKMTKDRSDTVVAEQVVTELSKRNPVEVPPSLVEQQCRMMEMEIAQAARRMGRQPTKEGFDQIHGRVHADAERKVRAGLLMAAIAGKLGMVVSDDDIQKGIAELAAETGKNVAKVRAEYADPQRRQILIGMILEDKVLDVIEGKAKITTGEPPAASDEESPAKDADAGKAEAKADKADKPEAKPKKTSKKKKAEGAEASPAPEEAEEKA